jgi:hypothetical protein
VKQWAVTFNNPQQQTHCMGSCAMRYALEQLGESQIEE